MTATLCVCVWSHRNCCAVDRDAAAATGRASATVATACRLGGATVASRSERFQVWQMCTLLSALDRRRHTVRTFRTTAVQFKTLADALQSTYVLHAFCRASERSARRSLAIAKRSCACTQHSASVEGVDEGHRAEVRTHPE